MISLETVYREIEEIKNDETKLYSYLYDLYYLNKIENLGELEKILSSFLQDSRSEIRKVAIYGLLFALRLNKEEYRQFAVTCVEDENEDEDLKMSCIMGLGTAYEDSSDKSLIKILYKVLQRSSEDTENRASALTSLLKIIGMTSIEIIQQNNNKIIIEYEDIILENFEEKLNIIQSYL